MTFPSSPTALVSLRHPSGQESHGSLFYPVPARGVAERTPSFMYPQGTASSQMVLRGMDLLLECIASGVYVQCAPPLRATSRRAGVESVHALFVPLSGAEKQTAPSEAFANPSHLHTILAVS